MSENPFRPISDKRHFPILSACPDGLCGILMASHQLSFMSPENISAVPSIIGGTGTEWHLYGDTRWPAPSTWVEFPLTLVGFSGNCGILVLNRGIPVDEDDPFDWAAKNNPLVQVSPPERAEAVIKQRLEMLRALSFSNDEVPGPNDQDLRFIQSYSIYKAPISDKATFVASYTDCLNAEGVPIQKYRMTAVQSYDVVFCRFALHGLFTLNRARIAGEPFVKVDQFQSFTPVCLLPNQKNPKWAQFHPCRTLRTRPQLRTIPSPELIDGVMRMSDYESVLEVRRREANLHMLAFDNPARPRETGMALQQNDGNTSMVAFIHRAKGGAIYVLPERLVEEFDNTDCGEVRVGDIKLPFDDVFLKFTPPQPVFLAPGAPVDGCYVVKQADEFFFMLTSCLDGIDYQRSLSVTCLDPTFSLHLPATDPEMSINVALERGIQEFLASNAPPEKDESTTIERPDGTLTFVHDIRAQSRKRRIEIFRTQEPVFRACLNIVVNAACFISFRPGDISEAWEGEPPSELIEAADDPGITRRGRDRKREATRKLENGDYTRIRICGRNLFSETSEESVEGHKKSPRTHWRRGHWRRQRHGEALSLVTLRWIRPTVVMKGTGKLVEARIYDIQEPAS